MQKFIFFSQNPMKKRYDLSTLNKQNNFGNELSCQNYMKMRYYTLFLALLKNSYLNFQPKSHLTLWLKYVFQKWTTTCVDKKMRGGGVIFLLDKLFISLAELNIYLSSCVQIKHLFHLIFFCLQSCVPI